MDHQNEAQPSTTRVERRIIEKNRRNQMKILYASLKSLLPNQNPKEALPLPDQIDEAIDYIKSLETKVKMAEEKKESLMRMRRKRSSDCCSSAFETKGNLRSPKVDIHDMGSSLEVVLTCGFDNQFIFNEIIRILHEENTEVISAKSSLAGDSMFHIVHAEIRPSFYQFGATKVCERLERFVNGSVGDAEIEQELWDFEIGTETWGLPGLTVSMGLPNPM